LITILTISITNLSTALINKLLVHFEVLNDGENVLSELVERGLVLDRLVDQDFVLLKLDLFFG
jgi:hypothetical protein